MNSSPDILNLLDKFEEDFKNVSTILKNFLDEAKKIVPNSSETCENFYKNLLQSTLDEKKPLAYIVNIQKIRDVFSEVLPHEYNNLLYDLEDRIPEIHKVILNIKEEIETQPTEMQEKLMDKFSLAKKEALPQPAEEETVLQSKKNEETCAKDKKDTDKAFSVSYKASMPAIEEDDVLIGENEQDIREKIAAKIANSISLEVKKIKEEDI